MPKCGGSSMREVLRSTYREKFKEDYDTFFQIPRNERFKVISNLFQEQNNNELTSGDMIYGHFFPVKYFIKLNDNTKKNSVFITFLRDPLSRLASHYSFWKKTDYTGHYLWEKMVGENWSFARFALSLEMKDFYSQYMFQFPLNLFNFIGIYENLENDYKRLCQFLSIEPKKLPHTNKSESGNILSSISNELKSEIRDYHAEDYFIYNNAVARSVPSIRISG
jgi:hypothetical protein